MAGTIFGIPLSQRVDLNGQPSVGWLLYLYQANTSTPVNSYQDTALTVLNPWPIPADGYGMMRPFWLADGSYRARATNADGSITYFDQLSVLALGASAGAAPSGGVDATTVFQTGDVKWRDTQGSITGWVRDNGRTIGNASSGGTERQNADCQALFEFLWNNFPDSICLVTPGPRGAGATADFTASKQITLPDRRGRGICGLDDIGSTDSGRLNTAPFTTGNRFTPGSQGGDNRILLTVGQLPPHSHSASGSTDTAPDHTHSQIASASVGSYTAGGSNGPLGSGSQTGPAGAHSHALSLSIGNTGNNDFINNVGGMHVGTWYRKL